MTARALYRRRVLPGCLLACVLLTTQLHTKVVAQVLPRQMYGILEAAHSSPAQNVFQLSGQEALHNVQDDATDTNQPADVQEAESNALNLKCGRQHTVALGETFQALAIRYKTTVTAIIQANGLTEADLLRVGQTLCIPDETADWPTQTQAAPAPLIRGERHVVQAGDTVSQIALDYGVPLDALARSNYLTDIDLLQIGQVLCIPRLEWGWPAATDTATERETYAVREGDTLSGIALEHGISLTALMQANRITECSLIRADEVLVIPDVEIADAKSPPDIPPFDFAYGIQGHALDEEHVQAVPASVRDLGFTWLKQAVRWADMEPSPGQRRWHELDRLLAEANLRGVHVLFSVWAAPFWARENGADRSVDGPPADNRDFVNYLSALSNRYCGQLHAIEVWNNQNVNWAWGNLPLSAEAYVKLLEAASTAIRAACPSMRIVSGAPVAWVSSAFIVDDFDYMQQMLEAGMAVHVDGIGAHPPGLNVPPQFTWQEACAATQVSGNTFFDGACDMPHHAWSFRSTMERYRALAVKYGASDKPIVPTQFGWAAGKDSEYQYFQFAKDNSLQEQADWTVQAFTMMRDWGWVGPAFLWNLNFAAVSPGTERELWSIVDADGTPKPVYTALKQEAK